MLDHARLDEHFRWVLRRLRSQTPRHVRGAARRARERHLDALEGYRRRGVFPRNLRRIGMVPHFVDERGARCAMAFLMEPTARDLVQHIARQKNTQRIRELAALPALGLWLEQNGITEHEAALIQPGYPTNPADACVCGPNDPAILEGVVTSDTSAIVVTAKHNAPGPIMPGDVIPVVSHFALVADTAIVARMEGDANAFAVAPIERGVLLLEGLQCYFGKGFATAPTDLPLDVFVEASTANDFDACVAILTAHSSEWDPTNTGGGGQGGSGTGGDAPIEGGGGEANTVSTGGGPSSTGGEGGGFPYTGKEIPGGGCRCSFGQTSAPGYDAAAWAIFAGFAAFRLRRRR